MPVTYPVPITTRIGKGEPLNAAEYDANLTSLKSACDDLNARVEASEGILPDLSSQIDALEVRAEDLEGASAAMDGRVDALESLGTSHGEVRLTLSGGSLVPERVGLGRVQFPDGTVRRVGASETPLASTGNANSTTYFIYLPKIGPIEKSTAGYVIDASGIAVKSGDPSRVLIGMARSTSVGAWADSPTQRFVLSFFFRRWLYLLNEVGGNRATGSPVMGEVGNPATERLEFLTWGTETPQVQLCVRAANSSANTSIRVAVMVDGAVPLNGEFMDYKVTAGEATNAVVAPCDVALSEGYHYVGIGAAAPAGTVTLYANAGGYKMMGLRARVWG